MHISPAWKTVPIKSMNDLPQTIAQTSTDRMESSCITVEDGHIHGSCPGTAWSKSHGEPWLHKWRQRLNDLATWHVKQLGQLTSVGKTSESENSHRDLLIFFDTVVKEVVREFACDIFASVFPRNVDERKNRKTTNVRPNRLQQSAWNGGSFDECTHILAFDAAETKDFP